MGIRVVWRGLLDSGNPETLFFLLDMYIIFRVRVRFTVEAYCVYLRVCHVDPQIKSNNASWL